MLHMTTAQPTALLLQAAAKTSKNKISTTIRPIAREKNTKITEIERKRNRTVTFQE
jgi:hypothetical protein